MQTILRYSHTVGFQANVGRGFNNPVDVAVRPDGTMYVVNRAGPEVAVRMGYKRVTICTVGEDFLGDFGTGGVEGGQLMWPTSVALDADGNVYISDEALHRISVFDAQGRFLRGWGAQGEGQEEFNRPSGITFDLDDNLLVVDGLNHRIQKFTKEGQYLGEWGRAGEGQGELNIPWGICVDHVGDVYVADWRNDRIQKFDAEGRYLNCWNGSSNGDRGFHRPSGVVVDADGNLIVADWGNERVMVLAQDGTLMAELRGESGVSSWGQEYFRSNQDELEEREKANLEPELDPRAHAEPREVSASIEKLFWGPTSVKLDSEGRLYVVESCRHRIQVYRKEV